jgi:hypothetical protein
MVPVGPFLPVQEFGKEVKVNNGNRNCQWFNADKGYGSSPR